MEIAAPGEAPRCLSVSVGCFVTGLFISYIFYLPTVWSVEPKMTKWLFMAVFLFSQVLTVLFIHLALKIVGGKALLRDTAAVYLTWSGIIYPILFALRYPFLIYLSFRGMAASSRITLIDTAEASWFRGPSPARLCSSHRAISRSDGCPSSTGSQ